jgi:hypothetical protein
VVYSLFLYHQKNLGGPGSSRGMLERIRAGLTICILVDSPTRRVGESFFDYEYLREFEVKIGTARNVV